MQKLLCHGNYCELVLSPVRASFKQPSAARPATGPTNSVAHPSIRGFKQPSAARPATGLTNSVAHPSIRGSAALLPNNDVHSKIAPNPRQFMARSPPRCCTSIIQSSALVQASFSLSMVALAARLRRSFPKNVYFRHFSQRVFYTYSIRNISDMKYWSTRTTSQYLLSPCSSTVRCSASLHMGLGSTGLDAQPPEKWPK